jgi:hypothetical protein
MDAAREEYRQHLTTISDSELVERCVIEKRLQRDFKNAPHWCLNQLWYECNRRKRPDLYAQALDVIRQEERERQAAIQRATEELT